MKQNVVFTSDMDELVERFLPLIRWTIHSYIRCREDVVGLSYDDLVQEGCIALCGAVSSYQPDKGGLQTYAVTVVRNRLIDYCRDVMAKDSQPFSARLSNEIDGRWVSFAITSRQ